MAHALFRRRARCFQCARHDVPLFTLHNDSGSCLGIMCGPHAARYTPIHGVTASPLGNLHRPRPWRLWGHPAKGVGAGR